MHAQALQVEGRCSADSIADVYACEAVLIMSAHAAQAEPAANSIHLAASARLRVERGPS